ncbi:MAG: T9SS type A sorting domain-containing protein [Bacteroidales bacterium]|nr:T9SS type A sorting domain-containing protein [Bacteroidales bacterium]
MSRIKILFLIGTIITCCSIVNAQNIDNIGFYSQSGGDAFVQYSFGGTFGCVLYGENGSLTITSEYVGTQDNVNDSLPDDDDDDGIRNRVAMGEGISVYPNPTAYFVNVRVSDFACASGSSDVEIYDVNGVLVLSRPIANYGEEFSMDLSGLANGTYIMRIGKASAKIVKK